MYLSNSFDNDIQIYIIQMNQTNITNSSIILIKFTQEEKDYCLGNDSFIRSQLHFKMDSPDQNFQNFLFFVQTTRQADADLANTIQFEEEIFLRHKISNKYLSYRVEEDGQNDNIIKLELSSKSTCFKLKPCFQYQTKIYNKIKFNEEIYLITNLDSAKQMYFSATPSKDKPQYTPILHLKLKSKLIFHSYHEISRNSKQYTYGSIVWIKNIEHNNFLTILKWKGGERIVFENVKMNNQLQLINGIWLLQSIKRQTGGYLSFNEPFYLKNIATEKYLSLSPQFRTVDKEKVYDVCLQAVPKQLSQFVFESLRGEDSKIKYSSYLKLKNSTTGSYIGNRGNKNKYLRQKYRDPLTFSSFEDEDLYQILSVKEQHEELIRFIFSISRELIFIQKAFSPHSKAHTNTQTVAQIKNLLNNVIEELNKLHHSKNFIQIQEEAGIFIHEFCSLLKILREIHGQSKEKHHILSITQIIYQIMTILCENYHDNQVMAFSYLSTIVQDIFKDYGAEQFLCEIFRNNYSLLCQLCNKIQSLNNRNLIEVLIQKIYSFNGTKNSLNYWQKIIKILILFEVILKYKQQFIDTNQRLFADKFFINQKQFNKIFVEMKINNQRIKIHHPFTLKWTQIQLIKEKILLNVIQNIFFFFSWICNSRNILGKQLIDKYINEKNKEGLQIIMSYLNVPVSQQLSNSLFSFITNCYIDSSPRVNRHKPLSFITFAITPSDSHYQSSSFQHQTDLLKENLLKKEYVDIEQRQKSILKQLAISNVVELDGNVVQPRLSQFELQCFKNELKQKLSGGNWSWHSLKSIHKLIELQSYEIDEIISIVNIIRQYFLSNNVRKQIVTPIFQILSEINKYCQELQLKKITTYLKYRFTINRQQPFNPKEIVYLLPNSPHLHPPRNTHPNQLIAQAETNQAKKFRTQFNLISQILYKISSAQKLKGVILKSFLDDDSLSQFKILKSTFKTILDFNYSRYYIVSLLSKCIVITNEEVSDFGEIFEMYLRMKRIISISQCWLVKDDSEQREYKEFCYYVFQFTNFFYNKYVINSSRDSGVRKLQQINMNRQLLMANLSIHLDVLKLLDSNHYLLYFSNINKISKKQIRVFELSFEFLYYFCKKCHQNIQILTQSIQIIHKFIDLIEVGQLKLINLIYRASPNLQQIIRQKSIQQIIKKVIKHIQDSREDANCEYNPQSLQFLLILCIHNSKPNKKNIQIIFNIIIKDNVFTKIMFFKEPFKSFQLQIDHQKFVKSPMLQVPLLYHAKIIQIVNLIIQNLHIQGLLMVRKIKETIGLEQLLKIIALPDIYSHEGICPEINFVLKHQILKLMKHCIQQSKQINAKLLESPFLYELLLFYQSMLIERLEPKEMVKEMNLYLPFLYEYEKDLLYDKHNLRDYYLLHIKPFLQQIEQLFENYYNRNRNKSYMLVNTILAGVQTHELSQNHLIKQTIYGIDQIQIKWRNFVDADINNSDEEKFSKRFILQFLMHKQTEKYLEEEENSFLKQINKNSKNYLATLARFIKLASVELNESVQVYQPYTICHKLLYNLKKYLIQNMTMLKPETRQEYRDLVSNLLDFVIQQRFQYNNSICRKIFYQTLSIYNVLFDNDDENYLIKYLYKLFSSNKGCFIFFIPLQAALKEILDRSDSQLSFQQINIALRQIYICGEERMVEVDKQSLKFLTNLCKHVPFTQFLRCQPYNNSIDLLQQAYNCFYFFVKKNADKIELTINISVISELILEFILSMMNGFNALNQNFIIDNRFSHLVVETLRLQYLTDARNKGQLARRERIVAQVLQFYESNGIDIKRQMEQKLNILDFRTPYIINRFKYSLLRVLYQSVMANERNVARLKIVIPIEMLKISLIEIYLQVQEMSIEYSEEIILLERVSWDIIVSRQNYNTIFLMIGFYIFELIQLHNQEQLDLGFDEQLESLDEEKLKENLVKKFFYTIQEKKRKQERVSLLQNEHYGDELKQYFDNYYNACSYFQDKTRYIQANVYGKLIKIFFPIIPLAHKLNQKFIEKLEEDTIRINHVEKIKSLMLFEKYAFQFLQGEQKYLQVIIQKSKMLGKVTTIINNEQNMYLLMWLNSLIIVIFYILHDFQYPQSSLNIELGQYFSPDSTYQYFLMVFTMILMVLGTLDFVTLLFKKIPFLLILYAQKYEDSQEKELDGISNSQIIYQISNTFSTIVFDIYMILFCSMTMLHPLFSGFLLLYIVKRIQLGKQILKAIKQTWFNLIVVTCLLIVFNYVFAILIYSATFTTDTGYGTTCKTLYRCLMMMFDQSFKSTGGFLYTNPAEYQNLTIKIKVFAEILYILFAQKVIFQIFAGTIIDKFSQLREKGQSIQKDQKQFCFICGQNRFEIDFQLQGFQQHIEHTHNKMDYIYYIFYLRKKPVKQYTIQDHFIRSAHRKNIYGWVPDSTSILKMKNSKAQERSKEDQDKQELEQFEKYYSNKLQEAKKLKVKAKYIQSQIDESLFL